MTVKSYLLSLPERLVRSALGLGAGVVREAGQVVLPEGVRRTQLYQNLVETTLRYAIERVGGAEGVYHDGEELPPQFLTRRAAGNAIELLGIVAFRASPVWVLAALADAAGMGRRLVPDIAASLKAQGLLDEDTQFTSVDELLDGLERTSSRAAATINTPPLDVAGLRAEWRAIRDEARTLRPQAPSAETIVGVWAQLNSVAVRQNRSVFEISSMIAVTAAARTGQLVGSGLLDHYRQTLDAIQQVGYAAYASRQLRPYIRAALQQFSPESRTLTARVLDTFEARARAIMSEDNKAIIRRAAETFSAARLEEYLKFYHPDVKLHFVPPGLPPGRDGARAYYQMFVAGFPDVGVRVDDLMAEGDKVACRFTAEGTHRGEFMGVPPSGRRVSIGGITIFRLADGQIVERWSEMNQLSLMQQIGAIPG